MSVRFSLALFLILTVSASAVGAEKEIKVFDGVFLPSALSVDVGDSVAWVWIGGTHRIQSGTSSLDPDVGRVFDFPLDVEHPRKARLFDLPGNFSFFDALNEAALGVGNVSVVPVTFEVEVVDIAFAPEEISIFEGDAVEWIWIEGTHTITSGNGSSDPGLADLFDVPSTAAATGFSFAFTRSEVCTYFCRPHEPMGMFGRILVQRRFIRGDPGMDGTVTISDPIAILVHLFLEPGSLSCLDAGDADDDGQVNVTDAIAILEHLFLGLERFRPRIPLWDRTAPRISSSAGETVLARQGEARTHSEESMDSSRGSSPIRRALVSVSDKTGLDPFVRGLAGFGVEIISTGGTAQAIRAAGVPVVEVSQFTGFPEMLDGRVKTLHPKVHGGLLFMRDNPLHKAAMEAQGFAPIDLVVVNLYPFESTVARSGVTREEAIEQIDIGGPSMLRSAAKNHAWVTVVSDPARYSEVLDEMQRLGGATSRELRERLAVDVFRTTSAYDRAIAAYFGASAGSGAWPERICLDLTRAQELRYGENPHQRGALYSASRGVKFQDIFEVLHGKALSYNNIQDLAAAVELVEEFEPGPEAAVAIIKHMNPCGVGLGQSIAEAWGKALACDVASASGGIVALSRTLDLDGARALDAHFSEIVVAPEFAPAGLELLKGKKNRILVRRRLRLADLPGAFELRLVPGGALVQEPDRLDLDPSQLKTVSRRAPVEEEIAALRFAWRVAKHVKSNAIVIARRDRTLGIGAGQMSRVDSARIAVEKARLAGLDLRGAVAASDAFFPFADGLVTLCEAGVTAAIEPGGSKRDAEVIAAADERNAALVFTSARHFRH